MSYATEHIARLLKSARQARELSQRELSAKSGVPQSHISKIETGAVDLRVSSLIVLARVLDLELMLVPRKTVPAVHSLVRSTKNSPTGPALKQLKQLQKTLDTITEAHPALEELTRLQHELRALQRFQLSKNDVGVLRNTNKALQAFKDDTKSRVSLNQALLNIHGLRNALAHRFADRPQTDSARPAYNLEEDDDG